MVPPLWNTWSRGAQPAKRAPLARQRAGSCQGITGCADSGSAPRQARESDATTVPIQLAACRGHMPTAQPSLDSSRAGPGSQAEWPLAAVVPDWHHWQLGKMPVASPVARSPGQRTLALFINYRPVSLFCAMMSLSLRLPVAVPWQCRRGDSDVNSCSGASAVRHFKNWTASDLDIRAGTGASSAHRPHHCLVCMVYGKNVMGAHGALLARSARQSIAGQTLLPVAVVTASDVMAQ